MKKILIVLLSGILAVSVTAQTLTVTFNGTNRNRNYQVLLDGTSYYSNSSIDPTNNNAEVRKDITLTNQSLGSHTIAIYRMRNNNGYYTNGSNTSTYGNPIYSNTFQLRQGYEMNISINGNGHVTFSEQRVRNRGNRGNSQQNISAMADVTFNQFLQSVRSKWLQSAKLQSENDAFNNTANYFSTNQVRQLLSLISSEPNRLALAKLAYYRTVDPANFAQLYDVFNSTNSRNDLNDFIRNNPNTNNDSRNNNGNWRDRDNDNRDNRGNNNSQYRTPISDYQYNQLLQTINSQYNQTGRYNTISGAFNNSANYFSTSQVRQLLSLINTENERLALAKFSYARISDASSFTSLYDLFNNQASRDELNNFINNSTNSSSARTPMADYQFSQLLQNTNNQYYQAEKVSLIRNTISNSNSYFSTSQIRQLLTLVNAENDRLSLAKLSYLRVSDPANFSSLYDLLSTQAGRNDLNNYVIQNGGSGSTIQYNTRTPMTDNTFSQVLQKVNNHFLPWDKTRDAREAFNNTSYYFNTSQIRQLLSVIATENDRLELAKLSWSRVTDPTYFTQLFDLFTSQVSRDDLNAYIQSHPF